MLYETDEQEDAAYALAVLSMDLLQAALAERGLTVVRLDQARAVYDRLTAGDARAMELARELVADAVGRL